MYSRVKSTPADATKQATRTHFIDEQSASKRRRMVREDQFSRISKRVVLNARPLGYRHACLLTGVDVTEKRQYCAVFADAKLTVCSPTATDFLRKGIDTESLQPPHEGRNHLQRIVRQTIDERTCSSLAKNPWQKSLTACGVIQIGTTCAHALDARLWYWTSRVPRVVVTIDDARLLTQRPLDMSKDSGCGSSHTDIVTVSSDSS